MNNSKKRWSSQRTATSRFWRSTGAQKRTPPRAQSTAATAARLAEPSRKVGATSTRRRFCSRIERARVRECATRRGPGLARELVFRRALRRRRPRSLPLHLGERVL